MVKLHPFKENRDTPVLISLKKSTFGEPLHYAAANKRLKRICEKVRKKHPQFTKRIYLTLMRHTDATESAKFLSEGITRKKHGWSKNSPMPNRYSHLVNSDVDEKILEHYGIHNEIERPQIPQKCSVCEMFNPVNSTICSKCGKPLDLQTAIELEEKEKEEKTRLEKKLGEIDELKERLARKEREDKERHESLLKLLKQEHQKGSSTISE